MEKDMVFFQGTQSADVGGGIPWGSFLQDLPSQCVSYSLSRQLVDVDVLLSCKLDATASLLIAEELGLGLG